jgi:hypothetical protein
MRHHDPEREECTPVHASPYPYLDDHPGMSFAAKVDAVTRREHRWDPLGVWPSRVVSAVENQPGSKPSEVWVERPRNLAECGQAFEERRQPYDSCTEGMKIVRDTLMDLRLRRSTYYHGR